MSEAEVENEQENEQKYEILKEDYPNYDLSFKLIVIGNSGKIIINILFINNRCWEIMFVNYGNKEKF